MVYNKYFPSIETYLKEGLKATVRDLPEGVFE